MPEHDDPYHAAVRAGLFTVAMRAVAITARMLVWSAPGGPDRAWQMTRAADVLTAVVAIVAALAIGEDITDPVVIGWFLTVLAATLFAFCMIANALAGIVARPARSARRHGCPAIAPVSDGSGGAM